MKLIKNVEDGFSHIVVPLVVVVGVGVLGTLFLVASHADALCKSSTFSVGSSGKCVSDIQIMTNWYNSHNLGNKPVVTVEGHYNSQTKSAVAIFQNYGSTGYMLTPNGIVGPQTWKAFCKPLKAGGNPPQSFLNAMLNACGTVAPY